MAVIYASSNAYGWSGNASTYTGAAETRETGYTTSEVAILHTSNTSSVRCTMPPIAPSSDLIWLHFRAKFPPDTDSSAADGTLCSFWDGGDRVGVIDVENGDLRVQAGDTFDPYGGSWSHTPGTTYTFDILVDTTGSAVTIELYVDGSLVSSVTNASHVVGAPTTIDFDVADFMGVTGPDALGYYSEFIIDDSDSTIGCRLNEMVPNAAGALNTLTGSYTDLVTNDDGAVAVAESGQLISWDPAAYGGPNTGEAVRAVVAQAEVLTGSSGPTGVSQFIRQGGTNYFASSEVIGLSASAVVMDVWASDPSGGGWTIADLGTMEVGIRADA